MKRVLHITLTVLFGLSIAGLLSGCALPMKEDIARSTTEFNLVAEKAGNEMLLLNIVRASKRRPMYFTSIGKLTGNKTFEYGTGGVSIPFGRIGGGANTSYSIAPSAGYKNSPAFDVTALNTQEFTRGIMTPVPMKTIGYYFSQGWPSEVLLHLFIRRIDIIDPNDPNAEPEIYINYPPGHRNEFEDFQKEIRFRKWEIKQVADITKIGEVDANEASKLQNLIEVQKAGLMLRQGKETNKMELYSSQPTFGIWIEKEKGQKVLFDEVKSIKAIYFRSPHAMLYYLGEIVRAEERKVAPIIPMVNISHDLSNPSFARLFYACKVTDKKVTDKDEKPCVSINYEGTEYVIPGHSDSDKGYCTDRSMQVLAIVSQLIGLQKKVEEAPATGVVSVIGR